LTFEGPTSIHRTTTPANGRKGSVLNDPAQLRVQLRPTNRINTGHNDLFCDPSDESTANSASPSHSYRDRSVSPATSQGSVASRTASYTNTATTGKKVPPPPPPSRSKKPPPPLPMKRSEFSATPVSRY
jgi:type IV secretory pathway VirB10-like protein